MFAKRSRQIVICLTLVAVTVGASWWLRRRASHARYERLAAAGVVVQRDKSGQITQINMWPPAMSDADFALLAYLPRLRLLNLSNSGAVDEDLVFVERLHSLEELVLNQTEITDAGLARLTGLKKLRRISVAPPMTHVGVYQLKLARPDLDISVRPLVLHDLNELRLKGGHGEFNDRFELVSLDLHGALIADEDLRPVARCQHLRMLNLSGTDIGDMGIAYVKDLANLQELWLSGTKVTDAGLETVAGFAKLQSISLAETQVTDEGMAHLSSLTALEILHAGDTVLSDDGLHHLRHLQALKEVYVSNSRVTTTGVARLMEAVPGAKVMGGKDAKSADEVERRVLG